MRRLGNMIKEIHYKKRNNEFYTELTKEEILNKIDINDPDTFLLYLKILDYPFIENIWKNGLKYEKNFNFSKYIAKMRLAAFRGFGFDDFIREEEAE